MREPLVWPGGTRLSASGLLVEIHTDEGVVGLGEAPGPTLPTIRTIIDAELTQFLIGQDPLRTEWLVHRMEEFTRNWARIGAYRRGRHHRVEAQGRARLRAGSRHHRRDPGPRSGRIRIDANMMWSVMAEFNPSAAIYRIWYPEWKNQKVWWDVGNGRITLDPDKRLPLYKDAQRRLLNDLPQIPLVQVQKFQVVRMRVQGMYVAFDEFNTGLRNNVWLSS